ncbi:hypothetical protein L6307_04390 [Candidatus Parcubacteria bacterium]|nr:hypothetical protein [Candidatus Parcubacteria bacterium]
MEQQNEQPTEPVQSSKNIWVTIVVVIVTALIVGGGVYTWQRSNLKTTEQDLQQKIFSLQNQISQLQQQNNLVQKQQTQEVQKTPVPQNLQGYELINGRCHKEECLFNRNNSNYPVGLAVIKGYYTKYLDKAWGEEKYCDSIIITDGTKELVDFFIRLVDGGNTVHDKNDLNQPIVNLNIGVLDNLEKQKFLNSTIDNPVELIVVNPGPLNGGVGACYSSIEILKVR